MVDHGTARPLPSELQAVLNRLRRRIRWYVAAEGLAIALIWLGLTFWIGLAVDYFPVLMGASEMPVAARGVMLALIGIVVAFILYRWILRRTLVRFRTTSLALVLEKKFPQLNEALITAVELHGRDDSSDVHQQLLATATQTAVERVQTLRVTEVLNLRPLYVKAVIAILMSLTVGLFGLVAREAFAVWSARLYALSERPWPRRTYLEVLGFTNGVAKVAKGGNLGIRVRADANRATPPPEVVSIRYQTVDGERGRVNMNRAGDPREGFQYYVFEGKPFQGILSDIRFDVVGNDYRIRDLLAKTVASPQVLSVDLDCTLPAYTGLVPRKVPYSPGVQLPEGTKVVATLRANKKLQRAEVFNKTTDARESASIDPQAGGNVFAYVIDKLSTSTELEITLLDSDGVSSQDPYRMVVVATPDSPPKVDVRLAGIGNSITPDAILPITGEITDDHGLDKLWFSLELPAAAAREFPIAIPSSSAIQATLDLQSQKSSPETPLELAVDSRVVFSLKATDKYNLEGVPHVSEGDRYELQVVTPTQLVALLEARELALRQRFEQMIKEMREMRDSLARVAYDDKDSPAGESTDAADVADNPAEAVDAGTDAEDAGDDEKRAEREASLRLLRVQRASQHSERASQEILGVALSFEDIRLELINNRIDSEERKARIVNDIANPLRTIAESMLPSFSADLERLEVALPNPAQFPPLANDAVARADEVLVAMENVLEKMLDLESYNQLLELVRSLIDQQEALIERTKEEQKKQTLELLQ